MTEHLTPLERARAIAGTHHAVISFRQAIAAGLSADQVDGCVRRGEWRRAVRGVFVIAGSPDTPMQRLWIAHLATAPAGGLVSFMSAAALERLLPPSPLPHVTVPPTASVRCPIAKVHAGTVPPGDRAWRAGLRTTSVSRTLADLATVLDRPTFEDVVDDAFCRKLATGESTLAAAARAGSRRRGASMLRQVVEPWTPGIEPGSVAEIRLLRLLRELGAPPMVPQYEVRDERGGFVARLDLAVPQLRVGVEYDGVRHHSPRAWGRDEQRYQRLRALGWHIASVSKLDLLPGEPRLASLVATWSARRAA